jgi:hypothetical protein
MTRRAPCRARHSIDRMEGPGYAEFAVLAYHPLVAPGSST